jgi:hypothetical protein
MQEVSVSVTTGTIVELVGTDYGKGISGAAYQLTPGKYTDLNLVLDQEDYTNASRWTKITPSLSLGNSGTVDVEKDATVRTSDGRWFKRTGDALNINAATENFTGSGWQQMQVQTSDKGKKLARELSDDFYVLKSKDVALPSLVYANVANQLFEDRAKIVGWMTSHAGNAEAITRYQALLEKIDGQLEKMGLANKATAWQATPSSRPSGPNPSLVVAFTPTCSGSTPRPAAMAARMASMWGLSRGRSAITTASTFTTRHPRSATRATTLPSSSRLSAPFQRVSSGGKWRPMSPSDRAPSRASIKACTKTSASLWPSSPSPSGCSSRTPPRIRGRPGTRR